MRIEAEVPDEFVDVVADAVVQRVIELLDARTAENQYMDVARTALYLGCSKGRVYTLARRGELPSFKFGGRLVFSSREIDEALRANRLQQGDDEHGGMARGGELSRRDPRPRRGVERRRERPVPPPLGFSGEQKESAAKALGLSRAEFDQLSPREYDVLWKQRVRQLGELTEEQKRLLFDWDPNVEKLSEMTVAEMVALADQLASPADETS
jgi:excisionase family DNA binding protein